MTTDSSRDERLAELLEQIAEQVARGEQPDLAAAVAAHPDLADELRELWGAVMVAQAVADHTTDHTPPTGRDNFAGAEPRHTLTLPCPFGDYRLTAELGRGGMGVVYLAQQQSVDRTVALKLILSGPLASPHDRERFRAEIESAARLDHPHIVPLYEIGQHDGQPYFSMKFVNGETLATRIATSPLDTREAATIVAKVARGVHYAHEQGVLHRDLKPSNILLDERDEPFITDFGLAKRLTDAPSLTGTGAILGTPSYMAPEQAAGRRGALSPATDVYSLGTMLYAALTGRPPFQAASPVDTVLMLLEQEPLPPHLINVRVDRDLEMIVLKCLQKPPELRYGSAAKLAEDLDAYLAGEPVSARSGRFSHVVARTFRETHHAPILENWGLLWMWHGLVLLIICLVTNAMQRAGVASPLPYLALWGGTLAVWAPIFLAIRRRAGPVTFVERQIVHLWGGSVAGVMLLFVIEWVMRQPVLSFSPLLGVINGMVFVAKAGILAGTFYLYAAALFLTAIAMAILQTHGYDFGITLFGIVSALSFFIPGLKYYRQSRTSR